MSEVYKHILVGIDGSESASMAFKKAIAYAKRNQAQLIIAHVVDPVTSPGIEGYHKSILEQTKEYGEKLLASHKQLAMDAGVEDVVTDLEFGSPKVKLIKTVAQKHDVDLIVCGAQGLNAIERFVLGSVSEYIVRHATCDVIVVRQ